MSSSRQSVRAFCLTLLESGSLEAKLRPPLTAAGGELDDTHPGPAVRLDRPVRVPELQSRRGGETLPPRGRLLSEAAQVICLQRFAHHELLAVELFAWALLTWPDMPPLLRRGMLAALADEQRHLGMYLGRLSAHGSHLGEAPLSDYLWRHVHTDFLISFQTETLVLICVIIQLAFCIGSTWDLRAGQSTF